MENKEEREKTYLNISKEQFDEMIRLYDPCMDDYLYAFDLQKDEYQKDFVQKKSGCVPIK